MARSLLQGGIASLLFFISSELDEATRTLTDLRRFNLRLREAETLTMAAVLAAMASRLVVRFSWKLGLALAVSASLAVQRYQSNPLERLRKCSRLLNAYMRIWLPEGFEPEENCGTESYSLTYMRRDAGIQFPEDKKFQPLPSGTTCSKQYDPDQGYYILMKVDMLLDYGIDYAFEFGMINARKNPPREKNVWRFETLMNNVILHLERDVESFSLQEIQKVIITPTDTTSMMQSWQ